MCKLMLVFIVHFTIACMPCAHAKPFQFGGNITGFNMFPNLATPTPESHGAKPNDEHTDEVVDNTPGIGNTLAVSTTVRYNLFNR